jgi:crossover junction endodeoxyribonuclease RusA
VSAPGWIPPKTLQHILDEQEMRAAESFPPGAYLQSAEQAQQAVADVLAQATEDQRQAKLGITPIPAPTFDADLFGVTFDGAYPAVTQQIVQQALTRQAEHADALLALCPHAALGHSAAHARRHNGEPCPYWIALAHLTGQPDPRERIAEWRVQVPFKDGKPPLSLNDRLSWPAHASKVERIKALTRRALIDAEIPPLEQAHIEMHYWPETRQLRDVDNLVATLKPMIDAFHQPDARSGWVGLLAGDDARYVSWSPPVLHEPDKAKGPATWLVVRTSLETR